MAMEFLVPISQGGAIEQNPGCVTGGKRRGSIDLILALLSIHSREEGITPIERVVPEARRMPLYKLMNDPFHSLGLGVEAEGEAKKVEESRPFAENRLRKAS